MGKSGIGQIETHVRIMREPGIRILHRAENWMMAKSTGNAFGLAGDIQWICAVRDDLSPMCNYPLPVVTPLDFRIMHGPFGISVRL